MSGLLVGRAAELAAVHCNEKTGECGRAKAPKLGAALRPCLPASCNTLPSAVQGLRFGNSKAELEEAVRLGFHMAPATPDGCKEEALKMLDMVGAAPGCGLLGPSHCLPLGPPFNLVNNDPDCCLWPVSCRPGPS